MKICLLSEYPLEPDRVVGGLESLARGLSAAFASRHHEVHVISFHPNLGPSRVEHGGGVAIHRHSLPTRFGNITMGAEERRLTLATIARIEPDIVHSLGLGPKALAAAESGVPWVVSVNGIQSNEARATGGFKNAVRQVVLRRLEQASFDGATDIIVSNPLVQEMIGPRLRRQRVHLVENQVDAGFFDVREPGEPGTILSIGRLLPLKAPEVLIDAAAHLRDAGHDFRVRFVGPADDSAYLQTLEARAWAASLKDRVTFLGFVSDDELLAELSRASILAHSSKVEVAPLSVMQAMAAGRPVVATRVGSTAHLVDEGRTGWLVEPGDAEGLAKALASLLEAPARAAEFGAVGRQEARERFLPERVVDRTLGVYRDVRAGRIASENTGSSARNSLEFQQVAPGTPKTGGEA